MQARVSCEEASPEDGLDAHHHSHRMTSLRYLMLFITSLPMDPCTSLKEQSSPIQMMRNLKWTVSR